MKNIHQGTASNVTNTSLMKVLVTKRNTDNKPVSMESL